MKKFFGLLGLGLLAVSGFALAGNQAETVEIEVNRSASCSCCAKWIEHIKQNNFKVNEIVLDDVQPIKTKYGVGQAVASCHTAIVNGYVVEGHVPADDIKALLKAKPKIVGISVPGMPVGTPGMEMGGQKDPYQVISFDKNDQTQVFNSYK